MTQEIIAQCSVSAKQGSNLARYVEEKVPNRFQVLDRTVEKELKQWAARETEELHQFFTKQLVNGPVAQIDRSSWE